MKTTTTTAPATGLPRLGGLALLAVLLLGPFAGAAPVGAGPAAPVGAGLRPCPNAGVGAGLRPCPNAPVGAGLRPCPNAGVGAGLRPCPNAPVGAGLRPCPNAVAAAAGAPAVLAEGFSLRGYFSSIGSRTRVVQLCVVAMCLALFILMRKFTAGGGW
jgi:hypothetical protein